jgi:hypothetical protein
MRINMRVFAGFSHSQTELEKSDIMVSVYFQNCTKSDKLFLVFFLVLFLFL